MGRRIRHRRHPIPRPARPLKSYTNWAAPLIRADNSGTLAVGKAADIAVWDRDPYSVPTAAIKDMKADMTLFRGQVVFERKP